MDYTRLRHASDCAAFRRVLPGAQDDLDRARGAALQEFVGRQRLGEVPALSLHGGLAAKQPTACLDCHKQGVGNPYPNADAEFNTPANGADANTRKSIHDVTYSPPSNVDCVKCHGKNHETDHSASSLIIDPDATHGVSGPMPPSSSSSVFCLECHDTTPRKLSNYSSPVNILDTWTSAGHGMKSVQGVVCEDCHTHHGSTNEKLIKTSIRGSAVMSVYSGNNVTVCAACHKPFDRSTPLWPGYSVYSGSIHAFGNVSTGNRVTDGRHGPGVCVNCHNPHGSRVAGSTTQSMTSKRQEDLCYTCHASGFDNFSSPGDYNNRWSWFGSDGLNISKAEDASQAGQNKTALHFGQAGGQSIAPGVQVYDGVATSNPFRDNDAVITMKLKVPFYAFYAGQFQVGMRFEDARVSSNYVSIFYRMHTSPPAWISRYYGDSGSAGPNAFGDEAAHVRGRVQRRERVQCLARAGPPDLVLLDLMLPELDGLEVCRRLRQDPATQGLPIVMLTARGDEVDRVLGLELGADDYVVKPFSPRELVARIRAVLRRARPEAGHAPLVVGRIAIDAAAYRVTVDGAAVSLTRKEFDLLQALAEAQGRVLSREYLLDHVWGYSAAGEIESRTVDVHVRRLRQKLGAEGQLDPTIGQAYVGLAYGCYMLKQYNAAWQHITSARKLGVQVQDDLVKAVQSMMQVKK